MTKEPGGATRWTFRSLSRQVLSARAGSRLGQLVAQATFGAFMRIDAAAHVSTDVFCLSAQRNAHAARSGGSCVLSGSFARCGVLRRGLVRVRCACGVPLIAVTHRGGVGRWTPDRLVVHVGGSTASRARSNARVHGRARRRTIGPARPPPCQPRAHGSSGTPRRGAPGQPGGRDSCEARCDRSLRPGRSRRDAAPSPSGSRCCGASSVGRSGGHSRRRPGRARHCAPPRRLLRVLPPRCQLRGRSGAVGWIPRVRRRPAGSASRDDRLQLGAALVRTRPRGTHQPFMARHPRRTSALQVGAVRLALGVSLPAG